MKDNYIGCKDVKAFSNVVNKLRGFFLQKGYVEVHTQDRLSILAACEDPDTVATFEYAGNIWPLPQTGQMWLEYELLTQPEIPGVFCVSTSYRDEKHPVEGRHKILFPMFEFESKGNMENLKNIEEELLKHLGFGQGYDFSHKDYDELKDYYKVKELSYKEENKIEQDFGTVLFLENFPNYTSPFWNMKKNNEHSNKIDVILAGQETIGSAERSSDANEMREQFMTISSGQYAEKLFNLFGKDRVIAEFEDFLSLDFIPRFGGGIGITRLIDAMHKNSLL